jgi:hypothetical protein
MRGKTHFYRAPSSSGRYYREIGITRLKIYGFVARKVRPAVTLSSTLLVCIDEGTESSPISCSAIRPLQCHKASNGARRPHHAGRVGQVVLIQL